MVDAIKDAQSHKKIKEMNLRRATKIWRKESVNWSPLPPTLVDGKEHLTNVNHGSNIINHGAGEMPQYNNIRVGHVKRCMQYWRNETKRLVWRKMMRSGREEVIPYEQVMGLLEDHVNKLDYAMNTIRHVSQVKKDRKFTEATLEAEKLYDEACKRFRNVETIIVHLKRLLEVDATTEAQRRAIAHVLLLFDHEGINMQKWTGPRKGPGMTWKGWETFTTAFLGLQNIARDWEANIEKDMEKKAFITRSLELLDGLPEWFFEDAAAGARLAGYDLATKERGPWRVMMEDDKVEMVLKHARSRRLREGVYSNKSRVAFLGGAGEGDNTVLMKVMLDQRMKYANELGYSSWALLEFSTKMSTMNQAYNFLARLRRESLPVAQRELQTLQEFAESKGVTYTLEHYDVDFWRQRLLEEGLGIREAYFRQFFQYPVVLEGLFNLLKRLFGVDVVQADEEAKSWNSVWDEHVHFYRVRDESNGKLVGSFFLDPFRRRGSKDIGFWVHKIQDYSTVITDRGQPRLPAVNVVLDLEHPRSDDEPVLLTHGEIVKTFHTFGRALRHLLCRQPEGLVAGVSGMEMEMHDMPAYFLERWAWEPSVVRGMSRHVETGDPLPEPALQVLESSRTFFNGMKVLRRTALAQIDLDLHAQFDPTGAMSYLDVAQIIEAEFSVMPPRESDHVINSLPLHREKGAGLFCDLWAEALAADVFWEFEKVGLDDENHTAMVGRHFMNTLLKPGAGRSPAAMLQDFYNRPTSLGSYMRYAGLVLDEPMEEEEDDDYVEYEDEEAEEEPGAKS